MAASRNNSWCLPGSDEAQAKIMLDALSARERVNFLDKLSRQRALTENESRSLEKAMKTCQMIHDHRGKASPSR